MKKSISVFAFLVLSLAFISVKAEVKPVNLFSDHMVLQRNIATPVWGTAKPGEKVTVTLNKVSKSTIANASGKWMVRLNGQKEGGPYKLVIKGKNTVEINDVLIGEVWLCSGQSNMDMTVAKENNYWCGVINEAQEVADANYPSIRMYDVDFAPNNKIQTDAVGKWEVCTPATVGHFSATAYFFARELYKRYKIPFGLIASSFGASTAEAWISEKSLKTHPNLSTLLDNYTQKWEKFITDSAVTMAAYRDQMAKFTGDLAAFQAAAGDVNSQPDPNKRAPRAPRNPNPMIDQHNPYVLYNGMISPLAPYAIRGALWYQGESNGGSARNYREIMETLVSDWRSTWGQGEFPFLYVQLANYGKPMVNPVENGSMVTVREAQVQNLSIPNTAMAVAIENAGNDAGNVHPKNKQDIGHRLAVAAMAKVYGEKVVYSGPMYRSYKVENNTIRLTFDHVGDGLVAKDGKLTGFAICGEDKKFVFAEAKIDGQTIVVSSPEVAQPIAVRYCWGTNPPASLSNKNGLWTPNFRTDNF